MNKQDKLHFSKVSELGCMICGSPAEIHHVGTYMGGGRDNKKVIPLCPIHHRNGGYGVAIHAGKKEFERLYGSEQDMLDETLMRLET